MSAERRAAELGLELVEPPKPVAAYVPFVRSGSLVFVSGQIPIAEGAVQHRGRVPDEVDLETARTAARLCATNLLSVVRAAAGGSLDAVRRVVRLGVFVACTPDFTEHPKVGNGASELMVEVFGEDVGRHARAAVGAPSLPLGVPVEVEGVFEIT